MKTTVITVLGVAAAMTGCMSLTPEGQRVRVTGNADVVHNCEFVGNVRSASMLGGSTGEGRALVDLQNETARLGGNTLHLTQSATGLELGSGAWTSGEAYRCP